MFNTILFFMYIFAGFAGVLAILLVALLIRYRSSGNKRLLSAIRNFMICTALIDFLYFYYDYDMLVNDSYTVSSLLRVADMCLFIGQVYFWSVYMREKSMLKEGACRAKDAVSLVCVAVCIVFAVIGYGFLMSDYYTTQPGVNRYMAVSIEIALSVLLTFINLWYLKTALCEVVQRKCRRYITCISIFLVINGTWNGILVIGMLTGRLDVFIETVIDPTPIFIFAINVVTILLILSEDFTSIFKTDGSADSHEDDITKAMDHIAEIHFLTEREREVMELAYKKMTNPEIADALCISKYTVKNHMHNIFEKLDVSTRAELSAIIDDKKRDA